MVKFNYGKYDDFKNLEEKDPESLYFLDNHQLYKGNMLIGGVNTVYNGWSTTCSTDVNGFPDVITDDMINNYYISFENGEIRYVTEDKQYMSISQIWIDNILVNQEFIQSLTAAIADVKLVTMPTLKVEGNKAIWTESNVDTFSVFVPKQ